MSPKSKAYLPRVSEGHAAGSTAITRRFLPPRSCAPRKGKASPAKFEPPPAQAMTMSGSSPAISICAIASMPITVWCMSTWLSTEPREYLVSSFLAATSTASDIAMPRLPGCFGSCARIAHPDCVSLDGEATHFAP